MPNRKLPDADPALFAESQGFPIDPVRCGSDLRPWIRVRRLIGIKTAIAYSTRERRDFFTENTAELLLPDISLGDGSGFELCQELRRRIFPSFPLCLSPRGFLSGCHGSILKYSGKVCKINGFTARKGAYYTTTTPFFERALK